MSVATEFAPDVYIPPSARRDERPLAAVIELYGPDARESAASLRLTRRGVAVLAVALAVLAAALLVVARISAPPTSGGAGAEPASVTVRAGDTLWSIAGRVAPERAPQAEVAQLLRVNHLTGADITPGQVLRTH